MWMKEGMGSLAYEENGGFADHEGAGSVLSSREMIKNNVRFLRFLLDSATIHDEREVP